MLLMLPLLLLGLFRCFSSGVLDAFAASGRLGRRGAIGLLVCRRGLLILTIGLITGGGHVLSSGLIGRAGGARRTSGCAGCSAGRHLGQADSAQRNSDR